MTTQAKMPLPGERNGLVTTESWMARLDAERAEHDAQRRDLQRRNTELVEQRRAVEAKLAQAETILRGLAKAPSIDGYFISKVWLLAQAKEVQEYFEAVV